jgi:membrane AbrB-like protein
MLGWILLLAAGALGAFIFLRLRLPGGSFLGAMLASAAVGLLMTQPQTFPPILRSVGLVLLGIGAGSAIERQALQRLRRVLPVATLLVLLLIATSYAIGRIVLAVSGDAALPATVILGVMPGGASGMAAAAIDLGADLPIVASMHSLRLVIVFGLLPLMLRGIARAKEGDER